MLGAGVGVEDEAVVYSFLVSYEGRARGRRLMPGLMRSRLPAVPSTHDLAWVVGRSRVCDMDEFQQARRDGLTENKWPWCPPKPTGAAETLTRHTCGRATA